MDKSHGWKRGRARARGCCRIDTGDGLSLQKFAFNREQTSSHFPRDDGIECDANNKIEMIKAEYHRDLSDVCNKNLRRRL